MRIQGRGILRTAGGAVVGATLGLAIVLGIADVVSSADGTSVAWAKGLVVVYFGGPIGVVVGGIAGGIIARRQRSRASVPAWSEPPRGTWRGHYPISWLGGWIVSAVVGLGVLPMAWIILGLFVAFLGMLFPALTRITWILVLATVGLCMVSVGRSVMRLVDRRIYLRRSASA